MDLSNEQYTPDLFIDWMLGVFEAKNDAVLSRKLEISPSSICKWRMRKQPIPAHVLIAIHEQTGMKIADIKARMFRS